MRFATPLADITEKEWAGQVAELVRSLSWLRYHTYRSERSAAGFPDEVLLRERLVFLELKREAGKLSEAQKGWVRALLAAQAEVYVARPRDLDDLARILAHRGDPWRGNADVYVAASKLHNQTKAEAA